MATLDGDVLIYKYELFNEMAVAFAELQTGIRDRMTPKDILEIILEAEPVDHLKHGRWMGTVCSVCGESFSEYYDFKFCPN